MAHTRICATRGLSAAEPMFEKAASVANLTARAMLGLPLVYEARDWPRRGAGHSCIAMLSFVQVCLSVLQERKGFRVWVNP
jgi:hypothetical protein